MKNSQKFQISNQIITDKNKLHGVSSGVNIEETPYICNTIFPQMINMLNREGIGLAAPQIGLKKNFFIFKRVNGFFELVINPKILFSMPFYEISEPETCLSIPNKQFEVKRKGIIRVEYINADNTKTIEDLKGIEARIFQHELDHLNGVLISDIGAPYSSKIDKD